MTHEENHEFLDYKKVIINFVFSFSWDIIKYSYDDIKKELTANDEWHHVLLYKRPLWWVNSDIQASYHPTIIADNLQVLHKRGVIDESVTVIAPCNKTDGKHKDELTYKEINASLNYDIRIYENGTGIFTFSFYSDKAKHEIDFEKILLLQHLATSISHLKSNDDDIELIEQKHLTHSYLKVSENIKKYYNLSDKDKIYLAELYFTILDSISELKDFILNEKEFISSSVNETKIKHEHQWQNPYVISIIEVGCDSLEKIIKGQDKLTTKEIGAIAVRLTLDNSDNAEKYFKTLRSEYIYKSLGFYISPQHEQHHEKVKLRNYSHSQNLFYTYGRRAAIAITSDFEMHPSYFAIPTFVNILELLRSRWHLGTLANLKLDETFEKISHRDDINNLTDEIFKCRVLYSLFLQNPTPYLFDSGAVTEISDSAESVFWLSRISNELEKKLDSIDRLVEVIYTKKTIRDYM